MGTPRWPRSEVPGGGRKRANSQAVHVVRPSGRRAGFIQFMHSSSPRSVCFQHELCAGQTAGAPMLPPPPRPRRLLVCPRGEGLSVCPAECREPSV